MKKICSVLLVLLLLVSILCSCVAQGETLSTQQETRKNEPIQGDYLRVSNTSDFRDKLKLTQTVTISYCEEVILIIKDETRLQSLIDAFAGWDAASNQTEATDTECMYLVSFGNISIRCNLDDPYSVIFSGSEPGCYNLPEQFLQALSKIVSGKTDMPDLYTLLHDTSTVTISTEWYQINGEDGLVIDSPGIIRKLLKPLMDWNTWEHQTPAQDTLCPWTICFDDVRINCNFSNSYCVVFVGTEVYCCELPEGFYTILKGLLLQGG